jgi:hypothetical protein
MPRKNEFDPNLVRINIKRSDHDGMLAIRRHNEPFYSMIHRIWMTYNLDKGLLENENAILKETIQKWMQRALDAESKVARQTLFQ